jgi:hypothetical protein
MTQNQFGWIEGFSLRLSFPESNISKKVQSVWINGVVCRDEEREESLTVPLSVLITVKEVACCCRF